MKKIACLSLLLLALACQKAEHSIAAPVAADVTPKPAAPSTQRMIVRTADVRITVADTAKAVAAITQSVEAHGGYVSGSHLWREGDSLRAKLTMRVPSDKLTSTLASIRGFAKRVDDETVSSEEVTQEHVDLGAQLRNLQAAETELRELMTGIRKNAKKAAEVLEMHQQLTNIRGEIERTQGRMRYLAQVSSFSQIALDITPDAILTPVVESGWRPLVIARDASRSLVGVLQALATAAIWMVIYILPIAAMFALMALAAWKLVRRTRVGRGTL